MCGKGDIGRAPFLCLHNPSLIGRPTLFVVVSVIRSHFSRIKMGSSFLFVKHGVFERRVEDVSAVDFAPFLWTFIDGEAQAAFPENSLVILRTLASDEYNIA